MKQPLNTIALLGRDTGLLVLQHALLNNPSIKLKTLFTHGKLSKAEGGGVRPELADYQRIAAEQNIELIVLDFPQAKDLSPYIQDDFDLLVSLSWRFILPQEILNKAQFTINLHRGALPAYAGAEPVKRALENGDTRFAITAHEMIAQVDMGRTIAEVWIDPTLPDGSLKEKTELIKTKLKPLYAPLLLTAIEAVRA